MMRPLNIRWKLTLWYGGVLAAVLALFSGIVYLIIEHHLLERVEEGLEEELSDVLSEIRQSTSATTLQQGLQHRFAGHEGFDYRITDSQGSVFFTNPRLTSDAWPLPASTAENQRFFETVAQPDGKRWQTVNTRTAGPAGTLSVQVGRSLAELDSESAEVLTTLLWAGLLAFSATLLGGYFLAEKVLAPVQAITTTARHISAEQLGSRIAADNINDELGELAQTINQMLDRLQRSFAEMQRFTADAAHELRTPLAIVRNDAEVALRAPRSNDEYRLVLENFLEETGRLSAIADELLFLCRHDAGLLLPAWEAVDLRQLIEEIIGNFQPVAAAKGLQLSAEAQLHCTLQADRRMLRRVLINLVDNAIKYSSVGQVIAGCQHADSMVQVWVRDTGSGIAAEHVDRIFDRFYRVDAARTGEDGAGAGLGLSICQSIVHRLGGTIAVESTPGIGTRMTVLFPIRIVIGPEALRGDQRSGK